MSKNWLAAFVVANNPGFIYMVITDCLRRYCRDYTLHSGICHRKSVCLMSVVRLSSAPFVHPTQRVEAFGNISSPFCTVAVLWPPCKILRRSSQGNPSVGGVKRKRGSKIERYHIRVSHLPMSFLYFGPWSVKIYSHFYLFAALQAVTLRTRNTFIF